MTTPGLIALEGLGRAIIAAKPFVLDGKIAQPRRPEERYRIYRLCQNELELVATAQDAESASQALITLAEEGEFKLCSPGILDSFGDECRNGKWILNPWEAKTA